jgi:thiamine biosynthesis lipoprotein
VGRGRRGRGIRARRGRVLPARRLGVLGRSCAPDPVVRAAVLRPFTPTGPGPHADPGPRAAESRPGDAGCSAQVAPGRRPAERIVDAHPPCPGAAACGSHRIGWVARQVGSVVTTVAAPEPFAESFPALGTTATVLVTERSALGDASRMLRDDLDELDRACSRFREDSEIRRLDDVAGAPVVVGPVLADHLDAAFRASSLTDGMVDLTVRTSLSELGYDRDFAEVRGVGPKVGEPCPAPGWWRVGWDRAERTIVLPHGVGLDLGATAKALAADRAAHRITAALRCGVLVNLGGDIAVAGAGPAAGWRVTVTDDHTSTGSADQLVGIHAGGLATSGVVRRRWRRGGAELHHIVDPRTGMPADGPWRTVSVAAGSCLDANIASTAAIVLGEDATCWLTERGIPARLVTAAGEVRTVGRWPIGHRRGAGRQ